MGGGITIYRKTHHVIFSYYIFITYFHFTARHIWDALAPYCFIIIARLMPIYKMYTIGQTWSGPQKVGTRLFSYFLVYQLWNSLNGSQGHSALGRNYIKGHKAPTTSIYSKIYISDGYWSFIICIHLKVYVTLRKLQCNYNKNNVIWLKSYFNLEYWPPPPGVPSVRQ